MARVLSRTQLTSFLGRRIPPSFTGTQRCLSSSAEGPSGHSHDVEETIRWRNITALAYVACTGLGIYQLSQTHHHEKHERPAYSYLRIRNKEFPWGPCGLFEWDCKEGK